MFKIFIGIMACFSAHVYAEGFDFAGYRDNFEQMDSSSEADPPLLILRLGEAHKIAGRSFNDSHEANAIIKDLGYSWREFEHTTHISHSGAEKVLEISEEYFSTFNYQSGEDLWPKFSEMINELENIQIHIRQSEIFDDNYRDGIIYIFGTYEHDLVVGVYDLVWT